MDVETAGGLMGLALIFAIVAAWVTHVVYSISHAYYFLLVIGAFIPPLGVIHGFMVWFGFGLSG